MLISPVKSALLYHMLIVCVSFAYIPICVLALRYGIEFRRGLQLVDYSKQPIYLVIHLFAFTWQRTYSVFSLAVSTCTVLPDIWLMRKFKEKGLR